MAFIISVKLFLWCESGASELESISSLSLLPIDKLKKAKPTNRTILVFEESLYKAGRDGVVFQSIVSYVRINLYRYLVTTRIVTG